MRVGALVVPALVALVAGAVRLRMLLQPSPFFYGTYDDGVHFAAALNLVHGNLPYRDVLFLQPPGVLLVGAPFAWLAEAVGDARAFVLARLLFVLVGALNAVLVALLLRRFGTVAALTGGLLYAVSFPAAYTERTISLEVLGTTGVLVAVLLLRREDRRARWALLAGLAAGAAIGFKVWYLVPFVVVAAAAGRRAPLVVAGGAAAGLAIYLPFFLAAPAAMWRQIVVAQLGRPDQGIALATRVRSILGVDALRTERPPWQLVGDGGVDLLLGLLAVMVVLALATRGARLFVVLLAATGVLLLVAPSYLQHYATVTAGPLALVGGVGAARIAGLLRARAAAVPVVAAVVLLALSVNLHQDLGVRAQKTLPRAALQAAVRSVPGCVVADDPTVLILVNRLTPDLRRGCTVQADPSGVGFTLTRPGRPQVLRVDNPAFQREILAYFRSGDAYLFTRGEEGLGLTPATVRAIESDPVLHRAGRFVLRSGR